MKKINQTYHLKIHGNISGIGFSWFLTKKLNEMKIKPEHLNKDIKRIELTITCTEQELNKLIQEINNFDPFDKYNKKTKTKKQRQKNNKQTKHEKHKKHIIDLIEITQ